MKKSILHVLISIFILSSATAQERTLFFSEYTGNGYTNVIEIFNPTADTVKLNNYSIVRNGTFRFDFPGGVLLPFQTWVGSRHEPAFPPDPMVLAVADTTWPAAGSIWYFSNTAKIELLKDGVVIDLINGDPRNAVVAGIEGALEKHTLIRKPTVFTGESDWNIARGTNVDDSQWLVFPVSYSNLKLHSIDLPNPTLDSTTIILSEIYTIQNDTIYLPAPIPVDTVKQNISPTGKASWVILDIIGNAVSSGMIGNGFIAKVMAETGISQNYFFQVIEWQDTLIIMESMVYTFSGDSLLNISSGTDNEILLSSLMLFPEGVTAKVTDTDGNSKTGGVETGDLLELTANDGLTKKLIKIVCSEPVTPSAYQVHNIAQTRIMPIGAPSYSDVNFTSRWARTLGLMAGPEALPAAQSMHATNFRWVYITNRPANNYPGIDNWISNEIKKNGFRISAALNPTLPDFPRGGGNGYDSKAEHQDGTFTTTFCPNKPEGKQTFMNHVLSAISMGSDFSIQMDDPHSYMDEDGVCFCKYCREKAGQWGMTVGTKSFKEKTVSEFWMWVQTETVKYSGIRIGYSCNNSSNHLFDAVTKKFDFMIGECDPRWSYGADKYFADERLSAEPLGKMQVYNLSVKGLVIEDPTLLWRNRSMIGLAYGIGGNCIVPWDSWMHPPIEERRYFGTPEEYADLFGFIRANSRLLEEYQTAFDYMPSYNDPRYGGDKPVTITGNNRAFAYMRAVPGDSSAAVVIHLIDWKETPASQPLTVNIKREFLFSGRDFGIYLIEPSTYDKIIHKSVIDNAGRFLKPGTFRGAEHEAVYNPLRKITKLVPDQNGSQLSVNLDSIPVYAMLVLVPAGHPVELASNELLIDQESMFIKGFEGQVYSSSLLNKINRSPLTSWMVIDQEGLPVYGQVNENSSLVVLSPEGRKLAQYALFEGEAHGLEVSRGQVSISHGGSVILEGVAVDSTGDPQVFILKNNSAVVFRPDTLLASEKTFLLDYNFNEILPGDSAEFSIWFHPDTKGLHSSDVKIRNSKPGVLPFSFNISGEGLAAGIQVYHGTKTLNAGTGILDFGSVKIDRDSVIQLSVVNTGNLPLLINGVQISKPLIVSLMEFDTDILPNDTGYISLKFTPSGVKWETLSLSINNNSTGFNEYKLNLEGFGLDLQPQLKVEYESVLFANNTGVVDFGNVRLNEPVIRKVVVRNTGIDNLTITNVTSTMTNFQVTSKPGIVEPGDSDTIVITFTPFLKLSYSTNITVSCNDKANSSFKFTVKGKGDDFTGIENTIQDILIYPNPAISLVNVKFEGNYSLRLLDVRGNILYTKDDNLNECELDVKGLNGIYLIEIRSKNRYFISKLIVK